MGEDPLLPLRVLAHKDRRMDPHSVVAGNPHCRRAYVAATSSASGVLWLTQDWRLLIPERGKQVCGPIMDRKRPDVERWVAVHPAKSASAYKCSAVVGVVSPTHPTMR